MNGLPARWIQTALACSAAFCQESFGLDITTNSLPDGMEMAPYSATLTALGAVPPLTWSVLPDLYERPAANSFAFTGSARGFHADDDSFALTLPFDFPFFGHTHREVHVSSNGTLSFGQAFSGYEPSLNELGLHEMIAVLWADLNLTDGANEIYVESEVGHVTIRWDAHYLVSDEIVEFSATLYPSGDIRLSYGSGNSEGGFIGISGGLGEPVRVSTQSLSGSMDNVDDILFVRSLSPGGEGMSLSSSGLLRGIPEHGGTYHPVFVAVDGSGARVEKEIPLNILFNQNERPVVDSSLPVQGLTLLPDGTDVVFSVTAADPENLVLTYTWLLNDAVVGGNSSTLTLPLPETAASSTNTLGILRCRVSDGLWTNQVFASWILVLRDNEDNDGDGMSDILELDLGRDPNDPSDGGGPSDVSGHVSGAGFGLPHAELVFEGEGGTEYYRTATGADGTYGLSGILPGHYRIKVSAEAFVDEWYPHEGHRDNAGAFPVPADSVVTDLDFTLLPGHGPDIVLVNSTPVGADIYHNGHPTGLQTPALVDVGEVNTGTEWAPHQITVRLSGAVEPAPVEVTPVEAETTAVTFDLSGSVSGSIRVESTPAGAEVFVDRTDVSRGVTPLTIPSLRPGTHRVYLRRDGYLRPRPVLADVATNQLTTVSLPLVALGATNGFAVSVTSAPGGARVRADFQDTGLDAPARITGLDPALAQGVRWRTGEHTVEVIKAGFEHQSPRIVLPGQGDTPADFLLRVEPSNHKDEDKDTLLDDWEASFDLNNAAPGESGPFHDPDGDGMNNEEEMQAGTNPVDAGSRLVAEPGTGAQGGMFTFVFQSVPGQHYLVLRAEQLAGPWSVVSPVLTASGSTTTHTVALPSGSAGGFYQAVALKP